MFANKPVIDPKELTFETGKAHYSYALGGNVDGVIHLYASEPVSVGLVTGPGYIPIWSGERGRVPFRCRDVSELRVDASKSAKIAVRIETRDLDKGSTLRDYTKLELIPPAPIPLELKALVRSAVAEQYSQQGITTIDVDDDDDLSDDVPDQDDLGPGYMDEDEALHPHGSPSDSVAPEPSQAASGPIESTGVPAAPSPEPATTTNGDTPKP